MTRPTPEEDQAAGPRPTRIFVGLKRLPGALRALRRSVPLRLVPEDDIHLTLVPPWNEISIPAAVEKLGRVLAGFDRFPLSFERLRYGPEYRRPRMLRAECAAPEIETLQGALIETFGQVNERPFRPHVTLARIERNDSTMARRDPVDQRLSLAQSVCSVELFARPRRARRGLVVASLSLGESRSDRH
jgi:RNA 2',3'-cyclic 3'-phosphodiesterase